MVIGVSVSDFALLVKAAWKTYHRWNSAYGHYSSITASLKDFCFHVEEISRAVDAELYSLLSKREEYVLQWETLHGSCLETVKRVKDTMAKHEAGRTRQGNWKRLKLAVDASRLEDLKTDLRHQRMKLSSFVSTLTLPAIYSSINSMATQMKRGNETVLSGWTMYTDDDPTQWRELRHTLHERYRHRRTALRQHKTAIMAYVTEAHAKRDFDEDAAVSKEGFTDVTKTGAVSPVARSHEDVVLDNQGNIELQRRGNPKLADLATADMPAARLPSHNTHAQHGLHKTLDIPLPSRTKDKHSNERQNKVSKDSHKRVKDSSRRKNGPGSLAVLPDKFPGLWTRQTMVDLLEGRMSISIHRKPMRSWFRRPTSSDLDMLTPESFKKLPGNTIDDSSSTSSSEESSDVYDTPGYDTSGYDTSGYGSDSSSDLSESQDRNAMASARREAKSRAHARWNPWCR